MKIRRYQETDHHQVWALHNLALEAAGAHPGSGAWDKDLHNVSQGYLDDDGDFLVGTHDNLIEAMGALNRSSSDRAEIKRMRVYPTSNGKVWDFRCYELWRPGLPRWATSRCTYLRRSSSLRPACFISEVAIPRWDVAGPKVSISYSLRNASNNDMAAIYLPSIVCPFPRHLLRGWSQSTGPFDILSIRRSCSVHQAPTCYKTQGKLCR